MQNSAPVGYAAKYLIGDLLDDFLVICDDNSLKFNLSITHNRAERLTCSLLDRKSEKHITTSVAIPLHETVTRTPRSLLLEDRTLRLPPTHDHIPECVPYNSALQDTLREGAGLRK